MTHKPPQGIDARCRYRYSNGTECNAEIVIDLTSPSGHMHAAGRDWLHWASPKVYGPQDSKAAFVAPPDPRKDLAALEELVAKWRGLRGVDWSAEPDGWKVTFNVCADELEQRLAEMRGAKR